jgi:2'-5' RNA ligase
MAIFQSFDEAWQSFANLQSVVTSDDSLEELAKGRGQLLAFTIPVQSPDILDYASDVQDRIAALRGISLIGEEDLHITLKIAGFQVLERVFDDDLTREEVPELDRQATAFFKSVQTLSVRVGAPNAFPDAVILEVDDGGALRQLNASLIEHVPAAHRYASDSPNYLPHITLARFEEQTDLEPLRKTLSDLRQDAPALPMVVNTVEFTRLWLLATGAESDPVKSFYLRGRS